jgi:hypothetical protein
MGVRLNGEGFRSEFAAKLTGEKALRELLDARGPDGCPQMG